MNEQNEERILDLLCKQAVSGLTQDETRELSELEASGLSGVDLQALEYTAAAISTLGVSLDDRMPDHLKVKILDAADEHFAGKKPVRYAPNVISTTRTPMWAWLGWAAAAAATVLLVANIWVSRSTTDIIGGLKTPTPTPEKLNPTQMRERMMASAPDMVKAEWGKGNMPDLAIAGDVVWSDKMQEGYLRFANLPKNDTSVYTYQLWIFDETQSDKTPIDGGTFDVNADGEIVVPIDAKLKARNAKAFAITMEKPGGVVVSDRKQIPALAPVKPNQA